MWVGMGGSRVVYMNIYIYILTHGHDTIEAAQPSPSVPFPSWRLSFLLSFRSLLRLASPLRTRTAGWERRGISVLGWGKMRIRINNK